MSFIDQVVASFDAADRPAVEGMLSDIFGMSALFGVPEGLIVGVLLENVGQERLDKVTTKHEIGLLVAEELLTQEGVTVAEKLLAEVDSRYDEPPKADFRLLTQVDESLKVIVEQAA